MSYTQSFVLYESVYSQFERLLKANKVDGANRYINAVMQYGLYGVMPEEDDEVWLYGLDNVIASIDSAKTKYRKKINIPEDELMECLRMGMTQKEIAEKYNCSVDTIQRRIKEYNLNCVTQQDYYSFDEETAENRLEKGRSFHSHSHSHFDSPYDSPYDSQYDLPPEAKALGF